MFISPFSGTHMNGGMIMNMYNPRNRRKISVVIIIILALAMILPMVASAVYSYGI